MKCPTVLIHLIESFLTDRRLQIKVGSSYSRKFYQTQGIPQGSPLAPFLYNVYCYDIYNLGQNSPAVFYKERYILQYADDTTLIAHGKTLQETISKLQLLLDKTVTWFNKWRLKPNPSKSQYIIFNHKLSDHSPKLTIANNILSSKCMVKYLGVILDYKLNFNQQSQLVKKQCVSRARHFRVLTFGKHGIGVKTAAHIYKTICRPVIEYAHPLYINCLKLPLKNLKVAESASLRIITKIRHPRNPLHHPSNELLYKITKVEPIEERLKKLTLKEASKENTGNILEQFCFRRPENYQLACKIPAQNLFEILSVLDM